MESDGAGTRQQGGGSGAEEVNPFAACLHQPFWDALKGAKRILLAGCGGGYDFFTGLPLYFALEKIPGVQPFLANLTFTSTHEFHNVEHITPDCIRVHADSCRARDGWTAAQEPYWPELAVSRWFREAKGAEVDVYMLERTGVVPMMQSYAAMVQRLNIDTIILMDGGTDSLMRGDEQGLGTPVEDMTSIAAVHHLECPQVTKRFLMCIGFGVDAFHRVCHARVLENVAALGEDYLGAFSLMSQMEEAQSLVQAYESCTPRNSIVFASVTSALVGHFGDYHHPATAHRTQGSALFINPLMSMYWCFRLSGVADRVLYLESLLDTETAHDVRKAIDEYTSNFHVMGRYMGKRGRIPYPH